MALKEQYASQRPLLEDIYETESSIQYLDMSQTQTVEEERQPGLEVSGADQNTQPTDDTLWPDLSIETGEERSQPSPTEVTGDRNQSSETTAVEPGTSMTEESVSASKHLQLVIIKNKANP